MKKTILMTGCLLLLLGISTGASAKDRSQEKSRTAAVVNLLLAREDFRVEINQVQPTGLSAYSTSPGNYFIHVNHGNVTLHLPYVGKGYNVPYGGGGNRLQFTAPITSYEVKSGKKGASDITLVTRNEDNMTVKMGLTIYPNGSAYVALHPDGLQTITYRGALDLNPNEER